MASPVTPAERLRIARARIDSRIGAADLADLSDVEVTDPATGEVLKWNGTEWVNGTASSQEPISKTLAYDGSDRLSVVTDARGTTTMAYDGSDRRTSVTGTGEYPSMTFTYTGDQLTAVTVT